MALDKMKDQAKQKKKGIQLLKTKNEQVSGAIKQKYLTKLKELESKIVLDSDKKCFIGNKYKNLNTI